MEFDSGLMFLFKEEVGIDSEIKEDGGICMGWEVRSGNGVGTCGRSLIRPRRL